MAQPYVGEIRMFAGNFPPAGGNVYVPGSPAPSLVNMSDQTLVPTGGDQPHNNMQPYLTFYFNIALQGVFPPRT